jgi:TonB family protein
MLLGSLMLAAANTATLQPTAKWQVDFGESHCVASREYGTAGRPLTLMLKAPASGDVIQLALAVAGGGLKSAEQLKSKVACGKGAAQPTKVLTYVSETQNRRLFVMNLARVQVTEASGVDRLTVTAGHGQHHSLALSSLQPVLAAMDECLSDLRSYWNYEERPAGSPPRPGDAKPVRSLSSLFNSNDYPEDALRHDGSGRVSVILLVDADGRVADCTLTQTSGVAVLDGQTCAVLNARARYRPAIGPDGKPRRSVAEAQVLWLLP